MLWSPHFPLPVTSRGMSHGVCPCLHPTPAGSPLTPESQSQSFSWSPSFSGSLDPFPGHLHLPSDACLALLIPYISAPKVPLCILLYLPWLHLWLLVLTLHMHTITSKCLFHKKWQLGWNLVSVVAVGGLAQVFFAEPSYREGLPDSLAVGRGLPDSPGVGSVLCDNFSLYLSGLTSVFTPGLCFHQTAPSLWLSTMGCLCPRLPQSPDPSWMIQLKASSRRSPPSLRVCLWVSSYLAPLLPAPPFSGGEAWPVVEGAPWQPVLPLFIPHRHILQQTSYTLVSLLFLKGPELTQEVPGLVWETCTVIRLGWTHQPQAVKQVPSWANPQSQPASSSHAPHLEQARAQWALTARL